MEVKRAEHSDFDLILEYIRAFRPNDHYCKKTMAEVYQETLKDPQNFVLLLQDAGKTVALLHGMLIYSFPHCGKVYHLSTLIVSEEERRKGYGKHLMNYAKKQAREFGCDAIVLESALCRKEAHAFYKAYGFKKAGYNFELRLNRHTF